MTKSDKSPKQQQQQHVPTEHSSFCCQEHVTATLTITNFETSCTFLSTNQTSVYIHADPDCKIMYIVNTLKDLNAEFTILPSVPELWRYIVPRKVIFENIMMSK